MSNTIHDRIKSILQEDYNHLYLELKYANNAILLNQIVLADHKRNQGYGTKIMGELCKYCDELNCMMLLTPDQTWGSNIPRLRRFYKRFGFKKRIGYSDLPQSSMIRLPNQKT